MECNSTSFDQWCSSIFIRLYVQAISDATYKTKLYAILQWDGMKLSAYLQHF